MKNIFWFGQVRTRSRMYDSISLACCFVMCVLIHSKSTHLVMLIWYGTMGRSLIINPHISTKRAPHRLETLRHKGRGEPRSPDQWSVSCFSTIWHAEGFLRYS